MHLEVKLEMTPPQGLFVTFEVQSCRETSLSANRYLSEVNRYQWQLDEGESNNHTNLPDACHGKDGEGSISATFTKEYLLQIFHQTSR